MQRRKSYFKPFSNTAMTASGGATPTAYIAIPHADIENYAPFQEVTVQNNSPANVTLNIDYDPNFTLTVETGGSLVLSLQYTHLSVTNLSTTLGVGAGEILVTVKNFNGGRT